MGKADIKVAKLNKDVPLTGKNCKVYLNGEELNRLTQINWQVSAGEQSMPTVTLTFIPTEFDIVGE